MRSRLRTVAAIVLALVGLAWWSGLTGLRTPAERAAVARLLEPVPPLGERNAYPAIWLIGFEMPESRYEAQIAEDAARWRALALIEDPATRRQRRMAFGSTARLAYPALPGSYGFPSLCFVWEPECLARVRADPEPTRAALARVQGYLGRLERLGQYDCLSNPFPRYGVPSPPPLATPFAALLSDAALREVAGDPEATARLCAVSADLRRLRAHGDDLALMGAIGSLLNGAARLYAEVRAERRADAAEVAACAQAFAPLADAEFELCPAFRRQYQLEPETPETTILSGPEGLGLFERIGWAAFDWRAHDPAWARLFAESYCGEDRTARVHARARLGYDRGVFLCNAGERLFHPAACASKEVGLARFDDYHDLLLDLDARLALMALADALARLPRAERGAAFGRRARLPIEHTHPFALDEDELSAPLLITRFEARARVPLPGSRVAARREGTRR